LSVAKFSVAHPLFAYIYPTSATHYFSHHFVEKGDLSYHTTRSTNKEIREREYTHTPQDAIEPFPLAVLVLRHRRGRSGNRRLELQCGEGGEVPHPLPHPAQSGVIPTVDVVGVGTGVGRQRPLALPVPVFVPSRKCARRSKKNRAWERRIQKGITGDGTRPGNNGILHATGEKKTTTMGLTPRSPDSSPDPSPLPSPSRAPPSSSTRV